MCLSVPPPSQLNQLKEERMKLQNNVKTINDELVNNAKLTVIVLYLEKKLIELENKNH